MLSCSYYKQIYQFSGINLSVSFSLKANIIYTLEAVLIISDLFPKILIFYGVV